MKKRITTYQLIFMYIFPLQSESPLLFKPLIKDLTRSEIHAIMTEGFATVSGMLILNDPD